MNTENEGKKIVNHLQVINEKIHFKWQLVGFNDIRFLGDGSPVASPSFYLHDDSTSPWQVSMIKTTFPEERCCPSSIFYDIVSEIDTTLDSKDNKLDLIEDEIRSDRSSEDSKVINEHSCEDSEFESEDTVEESSSDDEIKPPKKVDVKSTASQANLSDEEINLERVKCELKSTASQTNLSDEEINPERVKCELKSTASQTNLSDEEIKPKRMKKRELKSTTSQAILSDGEIEPLNKPNFELKSDKEIKPLNETDFDEAKSAECDSEPISYGDLKRALGFQIVKVEESSAWEVINYILLLTIGGLKKILKPKSIPGLATGKPVDYLFVYESDIGLNLDYVKIINIAACIDYTLLDCYPLVKQIVDSKEICEDLNKLLESQSHSDIILIAGDVKIPAHKSILSARSYGFDCMLQPNEQLIRKKLVLDLEKDVAEAMLTFMYAGGIPSEFPLEKCKPLSKAADEYKVTGLKETVKKFFINNLDPDVCLQCLGISESGLDPVDIPEEQLKDALQKEICLHKYEIE